jgi:hypothetical protein
MIAETHSQPHQEARGGIRFLENLAYLVPGYRGYKDPDSRREEDSRLRSRVLARLQLAKTLLEQILARFREQSAEAAAEALDGHLRRCDELADAVRYAPYGFSGFFDLEKVREETLETLLETDLLLFQDLDDLIDRSRYAPHSRGRQASTAFLDALAADIERVETRLVTRDKILGNS